MVVGGVPAAEGVVEPLRLWLRELGLGGAAFVRDAEGPERLVDAARSSGAVAAVLVMEPTDVLDEDPRSVAAAFRTAAAALGGPLVVCAAPDPAEALAAGEAALERELADAHGVTFVSSARLARICPGLPPRRSGGLDGAACAAIATAVARALAALHGHARKVIALDCDNTLWRGQAAEDGAAGVVFDEPALALQRFIARRRDHGMLLCLCSQNAEDDVEAVFATRDEMLLARTDFVAARVNWLPKFENLRSLARELGLGLDSFVFVDDDPVQCARVEARCPEVLTVCLPHDRSQIEAALDAVWALDLGRPTTEDARRTELYRHHLAREHARATAFSLDDFVRTLELELTLRPFERADAPRVSQLTRRTNQFNAFRLPRTEEEVLGHTARKDAGCLVVELRDRFGDYGLVGVAMFAETGAELDVDTLLVSCRALGRGVEQALLRAVAEEARGRGADGISVRYAPTARNEPARAFLAPLAANPESAADDGAFRVDVEQAEAVRADVESVARLTATQAAPSG